MLDIIIICNLREGKKCRQCLITQICDNCNLVRPVGTVYKLVGTSLYGGHNLLFPGWNRVKVAAKDGLDKSQPSPYVLPALISGNRCNI